MIEVVYHKKIASKNVYNVTFILISFLSFFQDTNGFTNANRSYNFPDQRQNIMKRPRPVKKLIRPIQHLRPIDSPKLEKSQSHQSREVSIRHLDYCFW